MNMTRAYFAAGCFWGVEKKFAEVSGVTATVVGYMGGDWPNPAYAQVCTGETGHAETVMVEFDPQQVSYTRLLEHFWRLHNPTCRNYQGLDIGSQYRSAIFYTEEDQRRAAEKSRQAETDSGRHAAPIVTEITSAGIFWRAEDYHQQYLDK
ncbi:peptide-methionine (S)-S-oxide reductase MsrA [Geopsychrobacter electrodiphilus]|uniref:peptide-methionine (S)-S-oxide reductase MsrA n=1 Tax=Geopsychrobacter electrodiphilus TaxID=225196 RepID=UPI00037674BB|nr:peptide-methionine (S)-S-oxide reductase MsrA [Geopsychrobacter electrodiphilus]